MFYWLALEFHKLGMPCKVRVSLAHCVTFGSSTVDKIQSVLDTYYLLVRRVLCNMPYHLSLI